MAVRNWVDVTSGALKGLWETVVSFLPSLIGAIVILVVGLIVASVLERLVERVTKHLKVDGLLRKLGVEEYFNRANIGLNSGRFLGRLVYWFLVIAFLLAASDLLKFFTLSGFIKDVLGYIPSILIAVLIMLATLVAAHFLRGLVRASVMGARLHSADALAALSWWVVFIFGFLTALLQLGVAVSVINTLITGLIAMLALAGGLAFGLGGRDLASDALRRLHQDMKEKRGQ